MNKDYLQALEDASKIIMNEYAFMQNEMPGQLDGYTAGWLSQKLRSVRAKLLEIDKKNAKRTKIKNNFTFNKNLWYSILMFTVWTQKSLNKTARDQSVAASICVRGMIDGTQPQHTKRLPLWA